MAVSYTMCSVGTRGKQIGPAGALQPPQAAGREVRLNYATQVETNPPTFAVFGNAPDLVEEHYVRYLHNGFRSFWGFTGNPLRILLRRKAG